ncbi:MAG: NAD-dependent epimerase/dehydratase family protein [Bdellovibrionota bacterium]
MNDNISKNISNNISNNINSDNSNKDNNNKNNVNNKNNNGKNNNSENNNSEKIALVTGANGYVGQNVCRELLHHGYKVKAMHRKNSDISTIKDLPLELVEGDLIDIDSLDNACKNVDYVFSIAGLFRQAKFPDEMYYKVNVGGIKNLLDMSIKHNVKRFIHCSTNGVMGPCYGKVLGEDAPYNPGDVYQDSKCEGEKIVKEYIKGNKILASIIRPTMIWGVGDMRFLKLFKGIKNRTLPIIGSGEFKTHWILGTDLAVAFRLCAEKDEAVGQTYLIGGNEIVPLKRVYEEIAKFWRVKVLPFKIPAKPLQILGDIVEKICVPFNIEPPIHRRRVDFFTKDRAFDISKAKRDLGFLPKHTFKEEVEIVGNWYKEVLSR